MTERLRQWLSENGLNALDLAKMSGVPKSTVYNIVNGEVDTMKVSVTHALKISEACGIPVEEVKAITKDEIELLDAWRNASNEAKTSALMVLKSNPAPVVKKRNGRVIEVDFTRYRRGPHK